MERLSGEQHNYIKPSNPLLVEDALSKYGAAPGSSVKVVLVQPVTTHSIKTFKLSPVIPPLGIAYIAALIEKAGYPVSIIDSIGEAVHKVEPSACGGYVRQGLSNEEIIERIDPEAGILGISTLFSQDWVEHRELIYAIRAAFPDIVIVIGGEHATALPEYILEDCSAIDFIVLAEGELTMLDLVHAVATGGTPESIPGIAYRGKQGDCVITGSARRIQDFTHLPRPAWHLLNVQKYRDIKFTAGTSRGFAMPILATRGCPYQCTFCSSPHMWTTRYVMRDPEDVADEIEDLHRTHGAESILFTDMTAFTKKKWILDLCREIKKREINVSLQMPSGTRSEALDEEVLGVLWDTGCKDLVYAPESGSADTLKTIKKRVDLKKMQASIRAAVKLGFRLQVHIIIIFPDEKRIDILKSVIFSIKLAFIGLDDWFPSPYKPYPGSEYYHHLRRQGRVREPSDAYFNSLRGGLDLFSDRAESWNVPTREMDTYRILATMLFYAVSYIAHPRRIARLLGGLFRGNLAPQNRLEQRLKEMLTLRKEVSPYLKKVGHQPF